MPKSATILPNTKTFYFLNISISEVKKYSYEMEIWWAWIRRIWRLWNKLPTVFPNSQLRCDVTSTKTAFVLQNRWCFPGLLFLNFRLRTVELLAINLSSDGCCTRSRRHTQFTTTPIRLTGHNLPYWPIPGLIGMDHQSVQTIFTKVRWSSGTWRICLKEENHFRGGGGSLHPMS